MRAIGRCQRGFDALLRECVRLSHLDVNMLGRIDANASVGFGTLEAHLILALTRTPTRDVGQLRVKAAVFGAYQNVNPGAEDDLSALLFAVLTADAARLSVTLTDLGRPQ